MSNVSSDILRHRSTDSAGDLRIRTIRATPVNIPLKAAYRWSVGYFPGFSKTIIEVETESGIVGVGETASSWSRTLVEEALAPRLIGADPRDLAGCERRAVPPYQAMRNADDDSILRAWGGVEMALWDVNGKIQGRPVASLLGGAVRKEIAYTEYFAPRRKAGAEGGETTPAEVAEYCSRMQSDFGARAFEGKVGFGDLAFELEMARLVRDTVGPEAMLRLDANMGWSLTTARFALARLRDYDVRSVEDPVATPIELARLRSSTSIGFSTHNPDLMPAVYHGVPDAIVVNLTALGGIARTVSFVQACQHLGIDVWFYSPDSGVANAAYRQVAAAIEWLGEPHQTLLRWHADDVVVDPLVPHNGVIAVTTEPGLGVTLDRAAMTRCYEAYRTNGPFDPYRHPKRSSYGPRRVSYNRHGL